MPCVCSKDFTLLNMLEHFPDSYQKKKNNNLKVRAASFPLFSQET